MKRFIYSWAMTRDPTVTDVKALTITIKYVREMNLLET